MALLIADWSIFFAVLLFIFAAFFLLALILILRSPFGSPDEFFSMIFYVILAATPGWWMVRFDSLTKRGLRTGYVDLFEGGFENLFQAYRYYGIATAVYVGIFALKIFFSMLNNS